MKKEDKNATAKVTETKPKTVKRRKAKSAWTIISALNSVLELSSECKLSDAFWKSCKEPLDYLTNQLDLTAMQVVALALLIEEGKVMSWRDFCFRLRCSRLTFMVHSEDMDDLVAKRWVVRKRFFDYAEEREEEGFMLEQGVVTALRHNQVFVPEKIDGLTTRELVDRMNRYVEKNRGDLRTSLNMKDAEEWFTILCRANAELPLCREALRFADQPTVLSLFLWVVLQYDQFGDDVSGDLALDDIEDLYPDTREQETLRNQLTHNNHPLQEAGLLEMRCADGVANTESYTLTRHCKEEILADFEPSQSGCKKPHIIDSPYLIKHTTFNPKAMFYNPDEQSQIDLLAHLLSQEQLPKIQERLEQQSMRKGFTCLFYGAPGTGKTETVQQIALQTGRDVMRVDIASIRDKWVGESEKNIRNLFRRYRFISKGCETTPILLFNEADALINKRLENIEHSVDKMDNAIQNIILQELEEFEGILIATTNLTCNLDKAFERRFLYKIEFHQPDATVQARLWRSMLGESLSEDDAQELAHRFNFSGGQIENIARKSSIHYIITGRSATLDELDAFGRAEMFESKPGARPVGFRA